MTEKRELPTDHQELVETIARVIDPAGWNSSYQEAYRLAYKDKAMSKARHILRHVDHYQTKGAKGRHRA